MEFAKNLVYHFPLLRTQWIDFCRFDLCVGLDWYSQPFVFKNVHRPVSFLPDFRVLKQQDADKLTRRTPNEIASEKSEDL
jgi:hypothetical protein